MITAATTSRASAEQPYSRVENPQPARYVDGSLRYVGQRIIVNRRRNEAIQRTFNPPDCGHSERTAIRI